MVSEDYDGVDSPWNLSNAVQVNEPKNLIWTRVNRFKYSSALSVTVR